ncbi:MAG: HlyC/CorC family transporter [Desulfobacterales bacterium]|nr:MAG: HlyC/CorC family transporter [Desulfobacterales bacterium]
MLFDQIVVLLILIFLSGFFSSAETALFSISKAKAIHLAKEKGRANQLIKKMKDDPHRLLSTVLIGNNIVNVGASALATAITISLVSSNAVGIATGIMTFLILIFGEIFPKSIATRNNILIARIVIFPLYWLSVLFYPIILFLNFIPKLTGKIQRKPKVTEEELMTMVEVVEEEGEIKEEEKELIHNIFEFDDTAASEIMTPRADMFVIEADQKVPLERILQSGYSRIPVIEGSIDHVVGILHIKDLFMHQATSDDEVNIREIMRKPYFVPDNKKLDSLLQQFKKRKQHMAIVVDEHGGVSGLITLEDALEEIVGEIIDETDKFEPCIIKVKNDEWRVLGKTEIDEVNEKIPMNIPDSKEYDTFSGYVLNKIGRIPQEKEEIPLGEFLVTVQAMEGNRVREYVVRQEAAGTAPNN